MDQVTYVPGFPWPKAPDGEGPSLALISPRLDNALPTSWYASARPGGTPGQAFENFTPGSMSVNVVDGATFRIQMGGVPGIRYRLERTPALGAPWTPVGGDRLTVDGQVIIEDTASAARGFYRIRAVIP